MTDKPNNKPTYKALAIDLDGTLLIGEDLPPAHKRAVADANRAGFEIIIATARWRQMFEHGLYDTQLLFARQCSIMVISNGTL